MKLNELFTERSKPLLEGKLLEIYQAIGPLLIVEDGDGGGAAGGGNGGAPAAPAGPGPSGIGSPPPGGPGGMPPGDGTPPPVMPGGAPPGCPPGNGRPGANIYGGWFAGGPFRPGKGGGGMNGNHWFNEFYNSLKLLTVSTRLKKRLKDLKLSGPGVERVSKAVTTATKNVKDIINKPMNTAYRVGSPGTFEKLPKPNLKVWNEAFQAELKKELAKVELL